MSSVKYEKNNIYQYSSVWERIAKSTDIKNQEDLAKVVGVTQGAVSGRKSKNIWPEEWAYRIGKKYNLLTEWILTGQGPKSLDERASVSKYNFTILSDVDEWLGEIVVKEPYRRDWFKGSLEDAFPMFKEWKKRKEELESEDNNSTSSKVA